MVSTLTECYNLREVTVSVNSFGKIEGHVIDLFALAGDHKWVESLRRHVDSIVQGEAFKGSQRSQRFLTYVVDRAIQGDSKALKERLIGIELFHRPAAYDTGEDAVVRVAASDVRKRLLQHYGRHGSEDEFHIEIPSGSYLPEVYWNPIKATAQSPAGNEILKLDLAASVVPVSPGPAIAGIKRKSRWIFVAAPIALLSLLLAFWAGTRFHAGSDQSKSGDIVQTTSLLPWSAILRPAHAVQLIVSDPDFATLQNITGYQTSLSDYANGKLIPENASLSPEIRSFCEEYLKGTRTADVDVPIVANIISLARPRLKDIQIRLARKIRPSDFHSDDDFILLGGPVANPWMDMFADQLDFRFRLDKVSGLDSIENVHPRGNELPTYATTGGGFNKASVGRSFAIVALVQNPGQTGQALLIAGTTPEGTEAAGHLVTTPSSLTDALRQCGISPNSPLQHFEILLDAHIMAGSSTTTKLIACHILNNR